MTSGWESALASFVCHHTGMPPDSMDRLSGGANNIGVRVRTGDRILFAKIYFRHPGDPRDRLGTEFEMLRFLWGNGIRNIPQPLAMEPEAGIGLYEYVAGSGLTEREVTWVETAQMAEFLVALYRLRPQARELALPPASEACFALADYLGFQEKRYERLALAAHGAEGQAAFADFVRRRLPAVRLKARQFVEAMASAMGLGLNVPLSEDEQTLSPADHGFHNVLRRGNGLVFLDFEYAGWDDPAQMLANACLQPQVPMPPALCARFIAYSLGQLPHAPAIAKRLRIVYPLVGIKWSLIMLNEFLPVSGERRRFAGADPDARKREQLGKSVRQLDRVERYLERVGPGAEFPPAGVDVF